MKKDEWAGLKNMTVVELEQKRNDLAKKLFDGRLQVKLGQQKNFSVLSGMKKDIARINTLIHQRYLRGKNEQGQKQSGS